MKNKPIVIILSSVIVLLLIPLIAMQFTTEVDWSISDFIIMGVLLLGTGFAAELIYRMVPFGKRVIFLIILTVGFLLVWAELAVGIFGTPFAGS